MNWAEAEKYLNMVIAEYRSIGSIGSLALNITLLPLKKRFDEGERTEELYNQIMEVE